VDSDTLKFADNHGKPAEEGEDWVVVGEEDKGKVMTTTDEIESSLGDGSDDDVPAVVHTTDEDNKAVFKATPLSLKSTLLDSLDLVGFPSGSMPYFRSNSAPLFFPPTQVTRKLFFPKKDVQNVESQNPGTATQGMNKALTSSNDVQDVNHTLTSSNDQNESISSDNYGFSSEMLKKIKKSIRHINYLEQRIKSMRRGDGRNTLNMLKNYYSQLLEAKLKALPDSLLRDLMKN
jgi:hypothetical protein